MNVKRNNVWRQVVCLSAAVLMIAGCDDEVVVEESTDFQPEYVANLSGDSLAACPILICNPWEHSIAIPLRNDVDPAFSYSGVYFDWSIERTDIDQYLVLKLKEAFRQQGETERRSFVESIELLGLRGETKSDSTGDNGARTLYLICQSSSAPAVEMPDYLGNNLGRSVNMTEDILAAAGSPMVNADLLYHEGLLSVSNQLEGKGVEFSGQRFEETHSQLTEQLGLSALTPRHLKAVFSGAFDQSFSKEEIESNEYEYHVDIYRKDVSRAMISPFLTSDPDSVARLLTPYLTVDAQQGLNNNNLYPQTREGMFRLFDEYGTHVITSGAFGGTFMYLYTRKQTCSYESTANAAGTSATLKFPQAGSGSKDDLPAPQNWLQTYFQVMSTAQGNISASGSDFNSEEHQLNEEKSFFVVRGGNMDPDFTKWSENLDGPNADLALISYEGSSNSVPGIIPIYELVLDPKRRAYMSQLLDTYMDERTIDVEEAPKLVVVDFRMGKADNGHKAKPEPKKFVSSVDNRERMYFPLVANNNLDDNDLIGRMLDTSSKFFLDVSDATDQLWYVAFDYYDPDDEQSYGISNICFMTEDEADNNAERRLYTRSGNRADSDMNWPAIDDHYVYLKATRNQNEMITGVGLRRRFKKDSDSDNRIIATSPGTDMLAPYNLDMQFRQYWSNNYVVGTPPTDKANQLEDIDIDNSWFGDNNATHHSNWIHPVYTRKALELPLRPANDGNYEHGNFMKPIAY